MNMSAQLALASVELMYAFIPIVTLLVSQFSYLIHPELSDVMLANASVNVTSHFVYTA